jgi:hypothetical protein
MTSLSREQEPVRNDRHAEGPEDPPRSIQGSYLMVAEATESSGLISLDERERNLLLGLLERELRDTHVEARRTKTPDFQARVHQEETVLRGLIDKLRRP